MKVSIDTVLNAVCEHYHIPTELLFKKSRERYYVEKRQMFYFMCCKWTHVDLCTIGNTGIRFTGMKQDHATVIHSRERIRNLIWVKYKNVVEAEAKIDILIENSYFSKEGVVITDVSLLTKAINNTENYSDVVA